MLERIFLYHNMKGSRAMHGKHARSGCGGSADGARLLRRRRDRTYEKVKNTLWDLFPTWEDDHYDRFFKEMMWASLGGALLQTLT